MAYQIEDDPEALWLWVTTPETAASLPDGFWTTRVVPGAVLLDRAVHPPEGAPAECPESHRVGTWHQQRRVVVLAEDV